MSDRVKRNIEQANEEPANIPAKQAEQERMSYEECYARLKDMEQKLRVAESDAEVLRECIVRMSLERYRVLG